MLDYLIHINQSNQSLESSSIYNTHRRKRIIICKRKLPIEYLELAL